jgi:hypothetical protein
MRKITAVVLMVILTVIFIAGLAFISYDGINQAGNQMTNENYEQLK